MENNYVHYSQISSAMDASGVDHPEEWLWEKRNGIYYPVQRINAEPGLPKQMPEFKISYSLKAKPSELITVQSSADTEQVFRRIFDADQINWTESMAMICLSRANKVIGFYKVSSGGVTGTVCDPKVIFQVALLCNASQIVICHNHPSGSLKPSAQDNNLTQKIKEAGRLLDVSLVDHMILTSEGYYSYLDDGML